MMHVWDGKRNRRKANGPKNLARVHALQHLALHVHDVRTVVARSDELCQGPGGDE